MYTFLHQTFNTQQQLLPAGKLNTPTPTVALIKLNIQEAVAEEPPLSPPLTSLAASLTRKDALLLLLLTKAAFFFNWVRERVDDAASDSEEDVLRASAVATRAARMRILLDRSFIVATILLLRALTTSAIVCFVWLLIVVVELTVDTKDWGWRQTHHCSPHIFYFSPPSITFIRKTKNKEQTNNRTIGTSKGLHCKEEEQRTHTTNTSF